MGIKQQRMAERIRVILSELLLHEIADPRVQGVTITGITLDEEMQYARVLVIGHDSEDRADMLKGLKSASSYLRREVGSRVRLRKTPELHFAWDDAFERGERIRDLLSTLDIQPEPPAADNADGDGDGGTADADDAR